jgi:bifunctional non-homologous end joining protein LigD
MLAESRDRAFRREGWAWELKYDGFRMLAERDGARCGSSIAAARTRGHVSRPRPRDARPPLRAIRRRRRGRRARRGVEAELRPPAAARASDARAGRRARGDRAAAALFLFDLLSFEGFDLRPLPLSERKRLLRMLVPRSGPIASPRTSATAATTSSRARASSGSRGVVGKKVDAPYKGGRNGDWVKVRIDRSADFAVVGYTKPDGVRTGFGALHLAYASPDGGGFVYAGRVGGGFTEKLLEEITGLLSAPSSRRRRAPGPAARGAATRG